MTAFARLRGGLHPRIRGGLHPRILFAWNDIHVRSTSTSWLDGLRGIAALQVFFFHFFGRHTPWGHTYGSSDKDYYLHQLPLFRPIWAGGSAAVAVFFTISGYAITVKSLRLLRQRKYEDLYQGISSSVFRRGFRLYLPVVLLAIPSFFFIRIFDLSEGFAFGYDIMPSFGGQFLHFLNQTDHHLDPFAYRTNMVDTRYTYVPSSWTIPMEYYGSMVCYVLTLVVARIEIYWIRSVVIGFMSLYAIHQGSWWTSNFLFGMWMADQVLQEGKSSNTGSLNKVRQILSMILYALLWAFGVYLTGMPPVFLAFDFAPVPHVGYMWLYKLFPPKWLIRIDENNRWYWYLSGNLIFLGVSKITILQKICNTKFSQWLGKLSFSLYLVHPIIIALLGRPLRRFIKIFTEHKGVLCFVELAAILPTVIVLSGVVERYIDRPSVQFAKWFEGIVFQQESKDHGLEVLERPLMANGSVNQAPD